MYEQHYVNFSQPPETYDWQSLSSGSTVRIAALRTLHLRRKSILLGMIPSCSLMAVYTRWFHYEYHLLALWSLLGMTCFYLMISRWIMIILKNLEFPIPTMTCLLLRVRFGIIGSRECRNSMPRAISRAKRSAWDWSTTIPAQATHNHGLGIKIKHENHRLYLNSTDIEFIG